MIAIRFAIAWLALLSVAASARAETSATVPAKAAAQHGSDGLSIKPPHVPENLRVEKGFVPFLEGHGDGTQNYVCKPTANGGFAFVLFTPQATLFNDDGTQLITHFFSPNPFETNMDPTVVGDRQIRVTWQAQDTSSVWAKVDKSATFATDPAFVAPGAVAWLLLDVEGTQKGPNGGDTMTAADGAFVQRVNTSGGLAPSTGCTSSTDVGNEAFVHYTADYFFYKKADD